MDNRNNTIAGWTLGACMAALALAIAGNMLFTAEKPEKAGFPVEGVSADAAGGGAPEEPIANLLAKADAKKGEETFKKCASCHTANQGGANGIGPNLYATVGEAVAEGKGGFAFSDALKAKGGKWDFEALNSWLTSPRKYAPGTKMSFAGLSAGADRANVILYLNSLGSNVPLPPPVAGTGAATDAKVPPATQGAKPGDKADPSVKDVSAAGKPGGKAAEPDKAAPPATK